MMLAESFVKTCQRKRAVYAIVDMSLQRFLVCYLHWGTNFDMRVDLWSYLSRHPDASMGSGVPRQYPNVHPDAL